MSRDQRLRASLLAGAAALAMVTASLVAAAKLTRTGSAEGGFHAKGPAGLAIDGKTADVDVADDGNQVTVTIALGNIDTGMEIRNSHTREDLDVVNHPRASLVVARSELKLGGGEGDAKGKLTIHGVTKDVTFHYVATKNGGALDVKGATTINVKDFGVKPRSYAGISIKPDVVVYANFSAKDG